MKERNMKCPSHRGGDGVLPFSHGEGGGGGKFPLLTQGVEGNSTDNPGEPDSTFYTAAVWQEQVVSITQRLSSQETVLDQS